MAEELRMTLATRINKGFHPSPDVIDAANALEDTSIRLHHRRETFVECRACGEWDSHTADCFIPALTRWLALPL